jgi:tetratricopeptide (TPR) repeat protein
MNWNKAKTRLILMLSLLSVAATALAQSSTPTRNDALFQKAESLSAGNVAGALAAFELIMQQSAETDRRVFGRATGEYWDLIHKQNNYPRAYDFFSQLAAAHPESADVLGSQGSAIGGYLGWLEVNGLAQLADKQFLAMLDTRAHDAFEKALKLDPENFGALFGYAIFESYQPEGKARSRELFAQLDALRAGHPYYPWSYVDQMKKQRLGN